MTRRLALLAALVVLAILNGCATNKTVKYTEWQLERYSEPQPALQQLAPNPKYQQQLLEIQREEEFAATDAMMENSLTEVETEVDVPQSSRKVVVQVDIPQVFPGAVKGRKYINVGYRPVNPNRPIMEGEMEYIFPTDGYVTTIDRDGKRVNGWLLAGTRVVGPIPETSGYVRPTWIRQCGNPILNEDGMAIYIRVQVDHIPQPSFKKTVKQQRAVPRARARASVRRIPTEPQFILQSVQQPPITRERWVQVPKERPMTCAERKSGWGSVIGGVAGLTGGILSGNKLIAAGAAAGGTLIGGWIDGGCIEAGEVGQAVGFGALGYALTKEQVKEARENKVREPRDPRDPRDPQGPAPLPPNGPPVSPADGPAPLPNNGPSYFNGGAPLSPTTSPVIYGPAPVPTAVAPTVYGPATMPATGPGYFPGS